jgi:hypothetical protein
MAAIKLSLFVWENVLTDYTSGIMFAYAENIDEAKSAILNKVGSDIYMRKIYEKELRKPYRIIESAEGFYVDGGA